MAGMRGRLLRAAVSLAVIVWLFSSRGKVQPGPDDDAMAPAAAPSANPGDDGVDPVFAFWMGFLFGCAVGYPIGVALVSLCFYFACGDEDDDEEAAGGEKVPCIAIRVGDAKVVPCGCNNV